MKNNICPLVQDLLPNYTENLCSEESTALVKDHLSQCTDCMAKLAGIYHPSKFSLTDPTGTKDYGERFANISFIESALRASPETQDKLVELIAEISERRAADEPGRLGAN